MRFLILTLLAFSSCGQNQGNLQTAPKALHSSWESYSGAPQFQNLNLAWKVSRNDYEAVSMDSGGTFCAFDLTLSGDDVSGSITLTPEPSSSCSAGGTLSGTYQREEVNFMQFCLNGVCSTYQ